MKCPDTGKWQAYLDGEIEEKEKYSLEKHIQSCPECNETLEELKNLKSWSAEKLATYQSVTGEITTEQNASLQTETTNNLNVKPKGDNLMKKGFKRWTAVAASIILITAALTMAPVQQAVANFLSIFRAQQIEVVQLDAGDMQQMANTIESKAGEIDLKQFVKLILKKVLLKKRYL